MEHIAAFMLLIACSDDLQACSEQPAPVEAYETVEQCRQDLSPAMASMAQLQKKTFGKCVEIDPALFYEDAEIVWDVTAAGGIEVAIELINPEMSIAAVAQAETPAKASQYN
ncbi:hypothetical protein [Hoeflea ulvae]|uniref:PepSY domain-containing protein n=1 Tax=Hoeflea ulvae TaxID=2983764 RepID=A0ABT3YH93_9HYPH|nr:hypothetical protein [Hoeflea ulvae]MCY0095273.1 hypothetical protein [Hoeflea ulvae]